MHHINIHLCSLLSAHNIFSSRRDPHFSAINQSLVIRPFIGKLINKYWQERIFLSVPNISSEKYINQLKLEGILIYKNEQKKFLLDFSKALLSGRIETSLNSSILESDSNSYISCIWKKGFNFSIPTQFILSFFNQNNFVLNKQQVTFLKQLKHQPLPLFTVTNNSNQIVLADSTENIANNSNFLDKIHKWYYNKFLFNDKKQAIYYGLFFMHPMDALEYIKHIKSHYEFSKEKHEFHLFSSYLSSYYKLTRTNLRNIQFRIIPDLQEISRLLYQYRYYPNLRFHRNQIYSKNSFRGQPLYIIEPFLAYRKIDNQKKLLVYSYNYRSNSDHNIIQSEAVFTNYTTLIKAWHKFKQKHTDYEISSKPKVTVYNLEDFIKDNEYKSKIEEKNILFIPSQASYQFIKNYQFVNKQNKIKQIFSNKFLSFKILSQRIFWSLTSRQPINW
uniref:Conserved hypothetical plastid protein n=1 Tax=Gracilaria tenuistipitata var. liui TaxID=285951 RepID=Q6B8N3_GRATL|nr:conserved hypothetical plastid protein [Gracilaria tenuistipitata var. liui]AAT79752.1 conserved hypothetical plastid protein [Gracilaria tenuistipitata var. liui]